MTKEDLLLAMNGIDEEYIEESERKGGISLKAKTCLALAAALVLLFSVTAAAAAGFFSTVKGGELVFMEAVGGYTGDTYKIHFNIDVAEDAGLELSEYYVPMYLEETPAWVDVQGEAGNTYSILVYDNYDENLFAIFFQYPAWNYDNGASICYSVPADTELSEGFFEVDGEELFCIDIQPGFDEYHADPFGTKVVFWSDGYNMFVLETRLTMDEEVLREIIRSVTKADDIADYAIIVNQWEE